MAIDNSNRLVYLRSEFKFGFWSGMTEPTGYYGPINFTKMEITPPKQKTTRIMSNMLSSFGTLMDSQPSVTDPPTLICEFDSMTGSMLSLLLGANYSDLAQSAGTPVTAEAVTPAINMWMRFANKNIDPSTVIFSTAGGTPTAIDAKHFSVDSVNGMYMALDSTGATAATVAYSKLDQTGETYDAGLAQKQYVQLVGTAIEQSTAKKCAIQIHKAMLIPSGKFDPAGNAYLKGAIDGDMLLPTGYPSAWRFTYLNPM